MREHNLEKIYADLARLIAEYLADDPDLFSSVRLMQQMAPAAVAGSTPGLAGPGSPSDDTSRLDLTDALSHQIAKDLSGIRARYLSGARTAVIADLDGLLALPAWRHLAASLRGRLLRTAALYRLDFGQDQVGAETLAERAAAEDPDGDGQVLAAHLALHRGDRAAAAALLEPPNSPQARHLKAAMLIQADDAAAALDILALSDDSGAADEAPDHAGGDTAANQTSTTAETWRLRALALLVLKRLPDAVAAIDEARALAPDWIAVRGAVAVIDFWRACAPAALDLTAQPLWPMPFARALVRADTQSRTGLAESGQTFADIAASLPDGSDEQGHWLTWHLIALIAGSAPRDEATALARRLVGDAPGIHFWPLLWAQFHGLDLDRASLKRRLAEVSPDDPNAVPLRGLYLELRLEDGEAEQVLAELPDLARQACERGLAQVPRQWTVAALTAAGRLDEAERAAAEVDDERLRLRLRLHIARERERAQPGSHKTAAAAMLAVDPGPDILAEACEAHARAADWGFVAEHADALLAAVPTPGSLRLLVTARFNQGQYQRCQDALDAHREVYPDGRLPGDLALLRVRCQRMLGEVSDAAREARRLWEQERTAERLGEFLTVQLESANTEGILEALQHLALLEPAEGPWLLQGARIAAQYDRDLGARLWRRAVAHPTDQPEFVVQAAMLGDRLGLPGEELKPWFQRMEALAATDNSVVRLLHLSEGLLREQQERHSMLLDQFRHGEAGLAMLPQGLLGPLPAILHADPEHNRAGADPLLQPPVLIRHGARPLGEWLRRREHRPRLILDLTALVTTHSLGLLDQVERAFGPLWLHRHWHLLLRHQIEQINPVQPRRSVIHAEIGQLVRAGGIALIDLTVLPLGDAMLPTLVGETDARNLEWARSNAARLLTYLPLHGPDLEHWQAAVLPPPWGDLLLGPRALLDGLLGEGLIDPQRHEAALTAFPPEPEVDGLIPLPPRGAALLSNTTLFGQFAELGMLTALSHRLRLHLTMQDWQRDQDAAENDSRRIALVDWTEGLIERVRAGGRYRVLPAAGPGRTEGEPELSGLGELLSHPGEPGDLLWVDDRFINGYPSTGTTPIIGIVEVLELLCAHGALNRKQRFRWLNRLRVSDYRFIPLDADEILHWLRQAHPQGNRLAVPAELEVIARYWAVCLYQGDALQWAGNDRHPQGELPFFVASQSAIGKVLTAIWSDDRLKEGLRQQRADWLLDNLYVGIADVDHLGPAPTPQRDLSLIGMDLAVLCFGAFAVLLRRIGQNKGGGKGQEKAQLPDGRAKGGADQALDAAEAYLRWICMHIVAPRLRADPEAVAPAAAALRGLILGSFGRDEDRLSLIGRCLLRFLPVLPPTLRSALNKDQDLMQRLGLAEVVIQDLDGLRFPVTEFWSAVEASLRGLRPILHEADTRQAFSVQRVSEPTNPRPIFNLADETGKTIREGYLEYCELLLDSRERRLQALRAHPHWWDGDPEGYEALERRLTALVPAERRIAEIIETAARSADAHYLAVATQWQCHPDGMSFDRCFPPPLAAVLTYLRCRGEADSTAFDTAVLWRRLVESIPPERGLAEPLRRIALLPCPLPDAVHARLGELDAQQTADLCGTLATLLIDPVGRLHLIDLLLGAARRWPAALELAQAQIAHVASARFDAEVELVKALVDLAYGAFGNEGADAEAEPRARLAAAWCHAGRIAGVLLAGPVDPASAAKHMRAWNPFPHRSLYASAQEPIQDLAWPWHVDATDLRYMGLGRVLAQHPETAAALDLSPLLDRLWRFQADEYHLLADPALLTDVLGCLWGGDRSDHLALLLGPDTAAQFSPVAFAARIDELLTRLTADPLQTPHWRNLWLTIRHGQLSGADADRLAAVLDGLDFERLIDADPMLQIPLLDLAVRHTAQPAAIAAHILRWAVELDTGIQPRPGFSEQFGEAALVERLVDWLHGLAIRDPVDPDAEFARLLESAIRCSRTFASQARDLLTGVARRLPYSRHRALRRTLLAARSRPMPPTPPTAKTRRIAKISEVDAKRRSSPQQPRS